MNVPVSKAYLALIEESKKQKLPKHYQCDLYKYDAEILYAKDAPKVFGWILREMGTWILIKSKEIKDIEFNKYILNFYEGNEKYYFWDGTKLKRSNAEKLKKLLL